MTDYMNRRLSRAEKRALLSVQMDWQRGRVPSGWVILLLIAIVVEALNRARQR